MARQFDFVRHVPRASAVAAEAGVLAERAEAPPVHGEQRAVPQPDQMGRQS